MPLLDGGALAWCEAVEWLGVTARAPRSRITRPAVIEIGPCRYEFTPGSRVEVEARVEFAGFDEVQIAPLARWDGEAADFRARIAPARTFALARDLTELEAGGLARHVDPGSVVVITPDAVHHAGRPFSPDEPARHKLLDLIGDLYLFGGPPLGRLRAVRPGHAANAAAFERARAEGIVVGD